MKRPYSQFAIILLLSVLSYAEDQVYQSVDKNGNTVVGNTPGGQIMLLPPLTVIPARQMQIPIGSKELKRRQILHEELEKELNALKDVTRLLNQSKKTSDKTQLRILQDAISEHQKNIDMLNKQLGS